MQLISHNHSKSINTTSALLGALVVVFCVGVAPATAETPTAGPTPATTAPEYTQLSDEVSSSKWAFVSSAMAVRTRPSGKARVVKRLTARTPDGTTELVLALTEVRLSDGSKWVKIRIPMRPNNRTGWVPRVRLGPYHTTTKRIVIDRSSLRLTLFNKGSKVFSTPIGIGKAGTVTPVGNFYVRSRLIPYDKGGIYGVFAFGLSAYSATLSDWPGGGMIGIHGTNQPGLIPGRISHGCIRLKNRDISRLRRAVGAGVPVQIKQ